MVRVICLTMRCNVCTALAYTQATLLAASGSASSNRSTPINTVASETEAQPDDLSDGFGLAVSNLIQTVKANTAAGFIPNNDGGGAKSEGRSEPPVGAKVTLQLVEKFGVARMAWVLECIFDDLLDFNDWEIRARTADGPVAGYPNTVGGLIALGGGNMQCARYESGKLNSLRSIGLHFHGLTWDDAWML